MPNIRELDLTIGHSGCVLGGGQPYAFDFTSHPEAKFPPLEVLKLNGYDLESTSNKDWAVAPEWNEYGGFYHGSGARSQKSSFPEEPKRMNNEEWLDAIDWSHIHTLHLTGAPPKVFQHLPAETLLSLKHLSLIGYGIREDFPEMAQAHEAVLTSTILPLESISLQNVYHNNPKHS